ncbi:polar amino acid ABC transporter, inner membrane subunit [Rippkaea orientalis PCC 8801]|uniref:Polar amino acid ABC transporter, inner membrane subunit n=1 Tax=Rippkaea orientalis (strain PCC 8801 / RF-1) TaxID=41431 RepID=B7K1N8_RIPO1|nr:amino acid ABC transporter permease [Rippkaea orientalis]ACK67580.1 polar amino acid ABC transporter, inner membrane subunit [Rippkaea orientalis PCC 8801]
MPNSVSSTSHFPPVDKINPLNWIQKNLFSTWYNSCLTIVSLLFLYWIGSILISWTFTQAQWAVIESNLSLFFVGRYPTNLLWRAWLSLAIIVSLSGLSWGILARNLRLFNRVNLTLLTSLGVIFALLAIPISIQSSLLLLGMLILLVFNAWVGQKLGQRIQGLGNWLGLCWLITFFVLLWLLQGGLFLETVKLDNFSGLILTLLTAIVSIVLSFPFGILLALGRQSSLNVIRWLSIAYIEVIRGLPLIGILFMAQIMLPLILPVGSRPDRVIRAIAGFTLFSAAYLAENVRGGLQSVPKGQIEAAKALGLNPIFVLIFIVLPQALKAVIPSIVGQFISLFKDTSLLAIVGLVDLLGISQSILANPKFIGRYGEVYLFIAVIYWIFCYSMSWASRKLEQKLN